MTRDALLASLAYAAPLAASWLLPDPAVGFAISLLVPLALASAGYLAKRPALVAHGGQAFQLLAAYALLAAFLGIVAAPGTLRFAGRFGSIPLDPDAIRAARIAFWLVATSRGATLLYLAVATLRGRDPRVPFFGDVPFAGKLASAPAAR
jgi:hypothetical protein